MSNRINKIDIVGLGALGIMYANYFSKRLGGKNVRVLMDRERVERYLREGVCFNGEKCDLNVVDASKETEVSELLLFCVKYNGLKEAMENVKHLVGSDTIIMSVLNEIRSEEELGDLFGQEKIIHCTAQKMDATKEGNQATCVNFGDFALGIIDDNEKKKENLDSVTDFLKRLDFSYSLPEDMEKALWSKLVCNVGVNQAVTYFEGSYADVQVDGEARKMMIDAMRECIAVGKAEGIDLSENDVIYWVNIIDKLSGSGMPSMRQDAKAGRQTEVELFAGTVCELGRKHGIETPVNDVFYCAIKNR